MNYEKQKKELEATFNSIKEEISNLEGVLNQKKQELLVLMGKWQAFDEMEKLENPPIKEDEEKLVKKDHEK